MTVREEGGGAICSPDSQSEAEKPRRRVGIADRKVFARPESFLRVSTKLTLKSSQNIVYVWKVSGQSGKFPDSLESFQIVWKVSGLSGKFSDCMESFWTVWKVSGQSGKFPDSLESFRTVWKVSGQSGKFLDSLESFQTVWKVS